MHSLREVAKKAARLIAHAAAAPFVVSFAVRGALLGRDRAIQSSTQLLALVPGPTGQYIRRAFLSWAIESCHDTVVVEYGHDLLARRRAAR